MLVKKILKVTAGLALFSPLVALSQPNVNISPEDMDKARESANIHSALINDAWIATKRNQVNQGFMKFNFDKIPQTAITELPDIGKIVERYKLEMQAIPEHSIYKTAVFISFNMPEDSLRKMFSEVAPIMEQVVFVLRGFDESKNMLKTVQRINRLIGSSHAQVNIDPEKFERFGIHSAPALVVYRDDPEAEQQCILEGRDVEEVRGEFVGVYGDASIEYSLSYLEKNTNNSAIKAYIGKQIEALTKN